MSNVDNGFEQTLTGKDNAVFIDNALVPVKVSFVIAAGAANITEIAVSIQDGHGKLIAKGIGFNILLSDDSAGVGLTAVSASGTVQAKSASGTDLGTLTAKKALVVQTLSTGIYTLEITDTAKTGFFIAVQLPFSGLSAISRQLVGGDYG